MSKIDAITSLKFSGGDDRSRTGDPRLAKPVLYQLSYIPVIKIRPVYQTNGGPDESRTCDLTLIRRAL